MSEPTAILSPLSRSDGSAVYNCPATGVEILGSVTGPVELPGRRDAQKPEDATLEVLVKPGTAQSAIGERYAEGIIRELLSRVVLGREKGFPRRGVVITLLILGGSGGSNIGRGASVSSFHVDSIGGIILANDRIYSLVHPYPPSTASYRPPITSLCCRSDVHDLYLGCFCSDKRKQTHPQPVF